MKNSVNIRFIVLFSIVLLMGMWRVLKNTGESNIIWNFTPIGAMALFAGTYFSNRYKAYLLPLGILFISDIVLMKWVYAQYSSGVLYKGWAWTYGSFLLMVVIGRMAISRVSVVSFLLISFSAALAHYVITDLGVWLGGGIDVTTGKPYPKNWEGLTRCFILAIPFFKNVLLSNLFFGTLLYGGFEWAKHKFHALRSTDEPVRAK